MRRSKINIIHNILNLCAAGASKTRIVYGANLNFKTAEPYIQFLCEKGLIDTIREPNVVYRITPEGTELLKNINQIERVLA